MSKIPKSLAQKLQGFPDDKAKSIDNYACQNFIDFVYQILSLSGWMKSVQFPQML